MLTVYTYPIPRPADTFDFSGIPLDDFASMAAAVVQHQKEARIWFGYLEGWMLTPHEEVRLRALLRTFPCIVISQFPSAFSHAWKNEIDIVYNGRASE